MSSTVLRLQGDFLAEYSLTDGAIVTASNGRSFRVATVTVQLGELSYFRHTASNSATNRVTVTGPRILKSGAESPHFREFETWTNYRSAREPIEDLPAWLQPVMDEARAAFHKWRASFPPMATWRYCGECARCGVKLFTDGARVTDTWDSAHCISSHPKGWEPNPHIRREELTG